MTYEERIKKALKRMVSEHILTPLDAMTIEEYLIEYGKGEDDETANKEML